MHHIIPPIEFKNATNDLHPQNYDVYRTSGRLPTQLELKLRVHLIKRFNKGVLSIWVLQRIMITKGNAIINYSCKRPSLK